MGFDEWWQLNARFGDDKVCLRQLWSAAIECAQRETVRYAEVQVAAERERWCDAITALAGSWDDPAEAYGMRLALNEGLKA